uniref:Proline rich 5 n=1 Tax=Bos mutus grunniens TaxID=30521 RepID=A0A8B9Y2N5_BOSMU
MEPRLKFMSSPSLSDLGKREPAAATAADERGTQQRRACANATWDSIHNGVIAVFQRKGLPDQELFSLNEGVRQLLKTELGSFFTEYLQNQLLTKGMVILRDKIRFYEGQKLLDSLAETWDFFFSDVLPTLQAVFYPVQVSGRDLEVGAPPLSVGRLRLRTPPPPEMDGRQPPPQDSRKTCAMLSIPHEGGSLCVTVTPPSSEEATWGPLSSEQGSSGEESRVDGGLGVSGSVPVSWGVSVTAAAACLQGKEPSVRQLALLHFRNTITLGVKLEDALARAHARVPPAIVQMLLVLQGVHESRGVTKDYLRLETLIQKVVSPYLGTYGLYSGEGAFTHSCILEKHYLRRSRSGDVLAKNPVVRSKSYNTPLLNPVAEHEAEGAAAGGAGVRRHSVSGMTSCPEPQGFADTPGPGPAGAFGTSPSSPPSGPCANRLYPPAQPPKPGPGVARGSPASSSPENLVDQILESVDSDSEGIFIDFGRGGGSGTSEFDGAGGRQSVV